MELPNEVNITITADDMTGKAFASALGRMLKLKAASDGLNLSLAAMAGAATGAAGGGGGGGNKGILGAAAAAGAAGAAFGGWGRILRGTIGGVAIWHIALDAIIEAIIAVGLASVAAITGIVAMSEAGRDLAINYKSASTASAALGVIITPLTGKFDKLVEAMAPQTIELYGGLLRIVGLNADMLSKSGMRVATMFDDWVAKIFIWSKAQGGVGKLLQSGSEYLQQFASIIGTVVQAIAGLLKSDPGIAKFLLMFIQGTASLFLLITKLPGPLLQWALGLHGVYLWGSVLVGVLARMGAGLLNMYRGIAGIIGPMLGLSKATGAMAGSFLGLSAVSWAWAAVAAAAIAGIIYESLQATPATKKLIASLNEGLSSESASQAIAQISFNIGVLNSQLQFATVANYLPKISSQLNSFGFHAQATSDALRGIGNNFINFFKSINLGTSQWSSVGHSASLLGKAFASIFNPASAGAGVQVSNDIKVINQSMDQMIGKQRNLFQETGFLIKQGFGYTQALALMDLAGVKAGDSFDLMKVKVQNLITGYENVIGKGGALTNAVNAVNFAALQQQEGVQTLNQGWDAFIQTIAGGENGLLKFAQDLNGMATSAKIAGSTFGGLNKQSITLTQGFQLGLTDANTMADNLTTLSNAGGGGADKVNLLNQSIRDMIAQMLPAARHSGTLTTELYALAQRGGYQGANSFKALSSWVGKTINPMQDLNKNTEILTASAGNLTGDVKNLSIALGTTLNDAMATAIFDATGGQKTFDNFAKAVLTTGINSKSTKDSALKLAESVFSLTGKTRTAHDIFVTFATQALGKTKSQAETLWHQTLPGLQGFINKMHGTTIPIRVFASGGGGMTFTQKVASSISSGGFSLHSLARGGKLPGFGGGDRHPALLEAGETVVSKEASRKPFMAAAFRAAGVPGYSQGGIAGIIPWATDKEYRFGVMAEQNFVRMEAIAAKAAVLAAAKASAQAATIGTGGSFGDSGVRSGSAAAAQAFARSIMGQYHWGPEQWPPWLYLGNQESGWNSYAVNPTSGAYGIGQSLGHGHPYELGDYKTQVIWMANYIKNRKGYGNPAAAWAHEQAYNWYDTGGWLTPGPNFMWNGTGKREHLSRDSGPGHGQHIMVTLSFDDSFQQATGLTPAQLKNIKYAVRVLGGGDVQKAFGKR